MVYTLNGLHYDSIIQNDSYAECDQDHTLCLGSDTLIGFAL